VPLCAGWFERRPRAQLQAAIGQRNVSGDHDIALANVLDNPVVRVVEVAISEQTIPGAGWRR
jgi:hypothetical protein